MPSRGMLASAALLAMLSLAPGALAAQQKPKPTATAVTTIRVKVTVLDPKGRPLQGAGVVLKQDAVDHGRMPKHPFDVEIHTDEKGTATVQGFEPGIVLVQVIAHGYQTYGQAFIMRDADEAVHVKLKPPRSQVTIYR